MVARYQVRSMALIDVVNQIKAGRLVVAPYFQRNLVWRQMHKEDFIDTILKGYPFPQIFISRGDIDVERMIATSLLVDGQQRLSTIREFVDNKFTVDGKFFGQFSAQVRSDFLKYEVAVIDLDMAADDPRLKEVFRRLNRTFYSLSEIEKLSTEFSTSEFMLVAKLLTRQIDINERRSRGVESSAVSIGGFAEDEAANEMDEISGRNYDPNIPSEFWDWADRFPVPQTQQLMLEQNVFTHYEISRMVHLMFCLNLLATATGSAFYSRNQLSRQYLETYASIFPEKDEVVGGIESASAFFRRMRIGSKSYWNNKANVFSLIICFYRNREKLPELDPQRVKKALEVFQENLPQEYAVAAQEAVNRKRERILRHEHLQRVVFLS